MPWSRKTPARSISSGGERMVQVGEQRIDQLRLGEMGIKRAAIGDASIYVRPGGYVFLELSAEKERTENGKLL